MFEKLKTQKALKTYGICALSVAFVCVILKLISMLLFLETDMGYFKSGAVLPTISSVLPAIAVLASVIICLIPKVRVNPTEAKHTLPTNLCAILPAIGFAVFFVMSFMGVIGFIEVYGLKYLPFIYYVDLFSSIAACIFFTLKAFGKAGANAATVICGLLTVIWFVISLVDCYFNQAVPMNSPLKLGFQFACLACMLFTVNEMRVGIDKSKKGFHLFSATFAAIYLPLNAIPSIICYLCGSMPLTYSLIYSDTVILLVGIFATARLIQMCFGKTAEPDAEAEEITDNQVQAQADNTAEEQ